MEGFDGVGDWGRGFCWVERGRRRRRRGSLGIHGKEEGGFERVEEGFDGGFLVAV